MLLARVSLDVVKTLTNAKAKAAKEEQAHQCRNYALFFHGMASDEWLFVALLFFTILSPIFTQWIRVVTPGVRNQTPSPPVAADVEATAIPQVVGAVNANTIASGSEAQTHPNGVDEPPPYQPPATESTPPSKEEPPVKRSSAQRFVFGTILLACNIACLFFLALAVQSLVFCQSWSPLSFWPRVIWWVLFSMPAIWALNAATCWAMLLRNLWGAGMKKRYPFNEHALTFTLFCIVGTPFFLLWAVFEVGAVKAVEACQRRFCGDALEEDEDVELAEGGGHGDRDADVHSEDGADEDRVGLIDGRRK